MHEGFRYNYVPKTPLYPQPKNPNWGNILGVRNPEKYQGPNWFKDQTEKVLFGRTQEGLRYIDSNGLTPAGSKFEKYREKFHENLKNKLDNLENTIGLRDYNLLKNNYLNLSRWKLLNDFCKDNNINVKNLQKFLGTEDTGYLNMKDFNAFRDNIYLFLNNDVNKNQSVLKDYQYKENKDYIDILDIDQNFKEIGYKFLSKLKNGEKINFNTPLLLVDGEKKTMSYSYKGKSIILPVVIGENGLTDKHKSGDLKTVKGEIHRFLPGECKKTKNTFEFSGYSQPKNFILNIISARLQSTTGKSHGNKYFHGVYPQKFPWDSTDGCIGIDPHFIRGIYDDIMEANGGYGYVDVA